VASATLYLHKTAAGPSFPATLEDRARLRAAATHAVDCSRQATDLMYGLGGGSAVYATSPLQRHMRDIHTATQHMMVAQPTWELVGRVLLGMDTDATQL
jgi:alkylation response protein AidB-like acyl-CoA dehydrogenase